MEWALPREPRAFTLDVQTGVDAVSWDGILWRLGSNVFHSSEWAAYTSFAQPNATPHFFSLSESGEVVCAALGFVSLSRFNILRHLWFEALPAAAGASTELISEFLALVEDWATDQGIHVCSMGSYGYEAGLESLIQHEYELERRLEFSLTLADRSIDEIWDGFDHCRRTNVRAAEKNGVTASECSSEEGLNTLRRLQIESSGRIVQRGGRNIAVSYEEGKDPFSILINRGIGRLFVAKVDGRPLSALLCSSYHGRIYCVAAGHAHEGLKYNSGTLLHWETIRRFKKEGARDYNLGGIKHGARDEKSPEHGLYCYKKHFGAKYRECANATKVLRPLAYSLIKSIRGLAE